MKTNIKNLLGKLSTGFALFALSVSKVSAALISPEDCPPGTTCTGTFRSNMISYLNYFLSFLGLLAVAMIVYAGILMVSAAGDEEQVKKGKTIILWAAVGIVLVLLAFTIVNWVIGVQSTTG